MRSCYCRLHTIDVSSEDYVHELIRPLYPWFRRNFWSTPLHRLHIVKGLHTFGVRVRTQTYFGEKARKALLPIFPLVFRGDYCFRRHRTGGFCSFFSFSVRREKCFRDYGDRFDDHNNIENSVIADDGSV